MRRAIGTILIVLVIGAGLVLVSGANRVMVPPLFPPGGSCTRIGGDLVISAQEYCVEDATVIAGDLVVQGMVAGNAVAIGGSVRVGGQVLGDVTSIGGEVVLHEGAQVGGDAIALEGTIQRGANAVVRGDLLESRVLLGRGAADQDHPGSASWTRVGVIVLVSGLTFTICLLLALVLHGLIPQRTRTMVETLRQRLFASLGLGLTSALLLALLLPLVSLFLMLIIIGLPLIPFLYLLVGVLWAAGLTITGLTLGEILVAQAGKQSLTPWLPAVLGLAVLVPLTVIPGVIVPCLGPAWALLVPSGGVGAILLSRVGTMA